MLEYYSIYTCNSCKQMTVRKNDTEKIKLLKSRIYI